MMETEHTIASHLRALAAVPAAEVALVLGEIEILKATLLARLMMPAPAAAIADPSSAALDVTEVVRRTGMSRGWLYREARAGRLPFARRLGRRLVFDEAGLRRWLDRRRAG
jgi:predicted DNA-binding transcriptional regulator AlpA